MHSCAQAASLRLLREAWHGGCCVPSPKKKELLMSTTSLVTTVSALTLSLSLLACGEDRRPATDVEKDAVLGVLATGLHLHSMRATDRVVLPPGTENLVNLVVDTLCKASVSSTTVAGRSQETLRFDCKDGDFTGIYTREVDHYSFDLAAHTGLDVRYTGDVTARRDFLDGHIELKAAKDLFITTVGVENRLDFNAIQIDPSGCMIGGGMRIELHANIPGKDINVSTDAVFGPTCGEVWVRR